MIRRPSWNELPSEVRDVAKEKLTAAQLDVFVLWLSGCSDRRIGLMLVPPLSRSTVRSRLEVAHVRLLQAGVRRREDGSYYLEEVAA